MKTLPLLLVFFVILATLSAEAENVSLNYSVNGTDRFRAFLNITSYGPVNASYDEGDEFFISVNASCPMRGCSLVSLYPLYCAGRGCIEFRYLEANPSAGIYLQGDFPRKCLTLEPEKVVIQRCDKPDKLDCPCPIVQPAQLCSVTWRVHAKRVGYYSIIMMATAQGLEPVYSPVYTLSVRGCGDGNCSANESYEHCPIDCCESDCTAVTDNVCHKQCDGVKGCSLSYGCDGKVMGWKMCILNVTYLSCCSAGRLNCSDGSYCTQGNCVECSRICDGLCESSLCLGFDPDCDNKGNASYPCCGNNRVDYGEQCDGNASGTGCDGRCEYNCQCPTTTTTTTSTTTTTTTTSSTSSTSTTTTTSSTTTTTTMPQQQSFDSMLLVPVALIFFVAAVAAIYFKTRKIRKRMRREYRELKRREETINELIKTVKREYADRRMNPEDATNLIYSYEKELAEKKAKRIALARKLGLKE